MSSLIDDLIF